MAKIDNAFETTKSQISTEINNRVELERTKLTEEYRKSQPMMDKLQAKLEDNKKAQSKLKIEQDNLETEIENLDPFVSSDEVSEFNKKHNTQIGLYRVKKSELLIGAKLSKTKAYKNKVAWDEIREQINNQYHLAISAKQKQQVIMSLQTSVDWKTLGINIPNLFNIQKVEVKNGSIILDNALPHKEQ